MRFSNYHLGIIGLIKWNGENSDLYNVYIYVHLFSPPDLISILMGKKLFTRGV